MNTKLPPQAPDMEQAVLGGLLLETEAWTEVCDLLTPGDFYHPANRSVYKAMQQLKTKGYPVDMLTTTEELKRMNQLDACGGPFYISQLACNMGSATHIAYHARVVKEKAHARRLIHIATQLVDSAFDETEDVYEAQEKFEEEFTALLSKSGEPLSWDMGTALKAAVDQAIAMEQKKQKGELTAIPTGLEALDRALQGGWRAPDLNILGARPSLGKTQFALFFAKTAAQYGIKVLFASLEMKEVSLINRYLLEDERINQPHLLNGEMNTAEWEALEENVGQLWNLPIRIAASYEITRLNNIRSEARRLKRLGELDFLIIDYLGQIQIDKVFRSRHEEIGYITRSLKNLAKELNIPILVLCQLTRPQKTQEEKRPQKEDLRESGDIEQDADIILMIHKRGFNRPDAVDRHGNSLKNRGELLLEKYREGAKSITIPFAHDERYKKIYPLPP